MWFGSYLLEEVTLREKNELIMIKKVTNTNRLIQRKTHFYYSCRYCVCSDITNRFANSPRPTLTLLELPLMLESIFLWHEFNLELLDFLQSTKTHLLLKMSSSFPKEP